jgi:hypothetical protein
MTRLVVIRDKHSTLGAVRQQTHGDEVGCSIATRAALCDDRHKKKLLVGTCREVVNERLDNAVEPGMSFCGTVLGGGPLASIHGSHTVTPYASQVPSSAGVQPVRKHRRGKLGMSAYSPVTHALMCSFRSQCLALIRSAPKTRPIRTAGVWERTSPRV